MLEPENHNKGSRDVRATSDDGLASGDMMGSGTDPTDPTEPNEPTNRSDQSGDLSGLEEWHIAVISFGVIALLFCFMLTLMVSSSIP